MLDVYTHCTPVKVSPEAPVLVMRSTSETTAPGGAANVAANLKAGFNKEVELLGIIGDDPIGERLIECLDRHGIGHSLLRKAIEWQTIEKRRFVDMLDRQMLRVDTESRKAVVSFDTIDKLKEYISTMALVCHDGLVISDYGKGTCYSDMLEYAIYSFALEKRYIVVNGKPEHFFSYRGASILIFNLTEAIQTFESLCSKPYNSVSQLVGFLWERLNDPALKTKVPRLHNTDLLVTMGDQGMIWRMEPGEVRVSAIPVKVADVAGAGDTVTAAIAAAGRCSESILEMAARAAADVVSQHGTSLCREVVENDS